MTAPIFRGLDLFSSTDGWAIGDGGAIYHWDGANWTGVTSSTSNFEGAIKMISPTDGWIVGSDIMHWDGAAWTFVPNPTTSFLFDVEFVSATEGWAVGGNYGEAGVILHYTIP